MISANKDASILLLGICVLVLAFFVPSAAAQEDESVCVCRNMTFFANQSHGLVKTPRYPRSYCGKLNCNWTIQAGASDEAIRLHWDQFSLHADDYLMVYYVENGVRVPVEKFSRKYVGLRDFVTARGQSVELNFVSSGDATGYPGFLLEFTRFKATDTNCACNRLLYNVSAPGEVTSPGWPGHYCHNIKCYYILHAVDKTKGVELTFDKVDFHDKGDAVHIINIYRPFNVTKEARDKWPDTQTWLSGARKGNRTFYSKGRDLLLIFFTDNDDNKTGFHAHYKQVENRCGCKEVELTSDSGVLVSPGYPDHFCEDLDCLFKFKAPEGKVVQLNMRLGPESWRLEDNDRLSWVDEKNTSLIVKDWGKKIRQESFLSANRNLFLRLTTGAGPGTGFNMTYKMVSKGDCKCPDISSGQIRTMDGKTKGTLKSPKSPAAYCGPIDCFYVLKSEMCLKAPTSTANRLFLNGTVETDSEDDFLQITAAPLNATSTAKEVRSYSGASRPLNGSLDGVASVVVQWHSSSNGNKKAAKGFTLNYQWRENCQCTERKRKATRKEQSLTSAFYDSTGYCNNYVCNWVVEAPPGERIVFKLVDLETEKAGDYLIVFDGKTTKDDRIYQVSGSVKSPVTVKGTHHRLLVQFQADGANTGKGFKGSYYSEPFDFANEKANPDALKPENLFNPDRQRDFENSLVRRMGSIVTTEVKEQVNRLRDEQKRMSKKQLEALPKPSKDAWSVMGPILLAIVAGVLAVGTFVYLKANGWCTPGEVARDYTFDPSSIGDSSSVAAASVAKSAGGAEVAGPSSSSSATAEVPAPEPAETPDGTLVDLSDSSL